MAGERDCGGSGEWFGGADRIRTCDLLIANETLYQLSYDPINHATDALRTGKIWLNTSQLGKRKGGNRA
jgi:hypothetical protein